MRLVLVDYGMGNLASARRGFEAAGASVTVSDDPASVSTHDGIVLPGVGAFPHAMRRLDDSGWSATLRDAAAAGTPLIGICLGMQLLAAVGTEGAETAGLNLIPGTVVRIRAGAGERVPHVGWNEVRSTGDALFAGIGDGTDFYFVHSYHLEANDGADVIATSPFAGGIAAAVRRGNVVGTQFHPEKSSRGGLRLLRNFVESGGRAC